MLRDRRKVGGQAASTTSAHGPSPSAPISTSLKTQATHPPSVRERARKYPTAVAPPISRRSRPQHVAGGIPPALLKPQHARGTQMLCYEEFAVLHSAAVRTPLWSAEHLTREQIEAASQLKRRNAFHSEPRL